VATYRFRLRRRTLVTRHAARSRVALTVDWTFVEGEIVTDSVGGWRFLADPAGTRIEYRVALSIKAPLPGFIVRRATDGLVAASIPGMFASIDRELRR